MSTIIYNNIIPFKGSKAVTIWPLIFARKAAKWLKDFEENHEKIHLRQQLEVLIAALMCSIMLVLSTGISWWWLCASPLVYYTWYGIEWLVRLAVYRDRHVAYRNIAFEQEAYLNQYDLRYPKTRCPFSWIRYIGRKTYIR